MTRASDNPKDRPMPPQFNIVVPKRDGHVVEQLMAEIPTEDHRDLTGRLMGDPLPGRSALDKRKREVT